MFLSSTTANADQPNGSISRTIALGRSIFRDTCVDQPPVAVPGLSRALGAAPIVGVRFDFGELAILPSTRCPVRSCVGILSCFSNGK